MANTTNTTITFVVKGAGSGGISVELNDVKNDDKSQFESGDTVYFKVFTSPANMQVTPYTSDGDVVVGNTRIPDTQTDTLTFAMEKEQPLSKLLEGALSYKWLSPGMASKATLTANKSGTAVVSSASADDTLGVAEVTYDTKYLEGVLTNVDIPEGLTEYPVVIVLVGDIPTA